MTRTKEASSPRSKASPSSKGWLIGYARTSTINQEAGLEAQHRDLTEIGCDKIFSEQISASSSAKRTQLEAALEIIREGDTLIVTKLDRLARSVADFVEIAQRLADKGAELRVLNMNLDTSTPTGKLMLNMLGAIAQFERELMLERQREGIAKAKAAGKYKGRVPTARKRSQEIVDLYAQGIKPNDIALQIGIGRSSVYRIISDWSKESSGVNQKKTG